jgi:hypothetical protein
VGQQQLLLIVLGVIVVGIAIVVGMGVFRSSAVDSNRDIVTNETLNLAANAMTYYKKPKSLSGGENTFIGWTIPNHLQSTEGGTYLSETYQDSAIIIGTGTEVVSGTDTVKVKTTVNSSSYVITVLM